MTEPTMSPTIYTARGGRVYAETAFGEREVATALTANGADLEAHDRALQLARQQRESRRPRVPVDFAKAPGLYEQLAKSIIRSRRSLNAEMIFRLERDLRDHPPGT